MQQNDRRITYPGIRPFSLRAYYWEMYHVTPAEAMEMHVHSECEIYIHVSGDVSFVVEDHLYAIQPGNIVITRPHEYHHCIYQKDTDHKHFVIQVSPDGNESLFRRFYQRKPGESNLLSLPPRETERLFALTRALAEETGSELRDYTLLFEILDLLNTAKALDAGTDLYPDVILTLNYINTHLAEKITVRSLAQQVYTSVNTLERHFHEKLGMTLTEYMRRIRLAKAADLLLDTPNVTEVCALCGFSGYSSFIAQFRDAYGITPLQYKKKYHRD